MALIYLLPTVVRIPAPYDFFVLLAAVFDLQLAPHDSAWGSDIGIF